MKVVNAYFYTCIAIIPFGSLFSQADTITIYENKSGIGFRNYDNVWFFQTDLLSYNGAKMNRQDSMVMFSHKMPTCYKILDKNNQLRMLGTVPPGYTYFKGEVRYYYPNGILKSSIYFDNVVFNDSCSGYKTVTVNKIPEPWGTWKYYNKDGKLSKTIVFSLYYTCTPPVLKLMIKTTSYNKNGKAGKGKIRFERKL
jgi:antitoxin component YwqK of YwqJK toxin-antitoxin module